MKEMTSKVEDDYKAELEIIRLNSQYFHLHIREHCLCNSSKTFIFAFRWDHIN